MVSLLLFNFTFSCSFIYYLFSFHHFFWHPFQLFSESLSFIGKVSVCMSAVFFLLFSSISSHGGIDLGEIYSDNFAIGHISDSSSSRILLLCQGVASIKPGTPSDLSSILSTANSSSLKIPGFNSGFRAGDCFSSGSHNRVCSANSATSCGLNFFHFSTSQKQISL